LEKEKVLVGSRKAMNGLKLLSKASLFTFFQNGVANSGSPFRRN
jgi:hypothetical protein